MDAFGAVGQVAGAVIQAEAARDAAKKQQEALERQRQFVFEQLDPSRLKPEVLQADIQRQQARLALQGITDPELLRARYAAQSGLLRGIEGLEPTAVERAATEEALRGLPRMDEAKARLIDTALAELQAGATLPPDVQAELVQAGLERTGMTTGAASPRGVGGQLLRRIIGERGLQLQAGRQARAGQLLTQASDLETQRQQLLGQLFPNLTAVQLQRLGGQQAGLQTAAELLPQAGMSGTDVANLWLARVGAANQLAQQQADIGAQSGLARAGALGQAIGGGISLIPKIWGGAQQLFKPSPFPDEAFLYGY